MDKYQSIKRIVDERTMGKVDNIMVDLTTANMLLTIADKLNPTNKEKFLSLPIQKMVALGWKLVK